MSQETKRTSLLFLLGTLISIILLSGSLSNLELHAGTPFPGVDAYYTAPQAVSPALPTSSFTRPAAIWGLILFLLTIYVALRLITFINLKWLLPWLFRFIVALAALFVFLVILAYLNFGQTGAPEWVPEFAPAPSSGNSTSPLGRPPSILIWFVAVIFMLVIGLFIIRILGQQKQPSITENPFLQHAKDAMQNLRDGKDFKDVIIHCYLQMMNTLREERGLERSHEMTAREFQGWLESKGLPRVPVQNLTNLFEQVRYGQQQICENDQKAAMDSLSEIIHFAERTKDEVPSD